ncbi:MAG TPA: hypothetical protein PLA19_05500 [Candidatus Pacearchaeota archaeon]|jgi:hypothetical protein|nr:hypothetical protein [Candidatus Pacearchaeota archaeon]
MNKKIKTAAIIAAILGLLALIWFFAADYLFAFILSKIFPPGPPAPTTQLLPCNGVPASQAELGYPYIVNDKTAEFTTSGGEIYVVARSYEHGILLPSRGGTGIYVGISTELPVWDKQRSTISNVYQGVTALEKDYGTLTLPAGRYWLWSSAGGDIVVYSCQPDGVSDPKPVR